MVPSIKGVVIVQLDHETCRQARDLADLLLVRHTVTPRPRGARVAMRDLVAAQFAVAQHFHAPAPTEPEVVRTASGIVHVVLARPAENALPFDQAADADDAYLVVIPLGDDRFELRLTLSSTDNAAAGAHQ